MHNCVSFVIMKFDPAFVTVVIDHLPVVRSQIEASRLLVLISQNMFILTLCFSSSINFCVISKVRNAEFSSIGQIWRSFRKITIIRNKLLYLYSHFLFFNFRLVENDLFKQDWRSRSPAHIFQYVILKWAFCFLIGALAGWTGFLTNLAVENVAGIKFVVTSNMMLAQR